MKRENIHEEDKGIILGINNSTPKWFVKRVEKLSFNKVILITRFFEDL